MELVKHVTKYCIKCLNMFLIGKTLMPLRVLHMLQLAFCAVEKKISIPICHCEWSTYGNRRP